MLTRRDTLTGLGGSLLLASMARGQDSPETQVLIRNVRIFDGMSATLRPGSVLISGQTIAEVSADDIEAPSGAQVVDGQNGVLMPGKTDAHWHMIFGPNNLRNMSLPDQGLTHAEAERTFLRGFTSVRDVGDAIFGLKRAIDIGAVRCRGRGSSPCAHCGVETDLVMDHAVPINKQTLGDHAPLREIIELAHQDLQHPADRYATIINTVLRGETD